jgi:5-methylcytosine-specific restriction endonuclease McrA
LPRAKRAIGWKRREAKKASTVTEEERERILVAFGRRCGYCRIIWASEWDHRVPIARGGKDVASNLVPVCPACNQKKGTQTWPVPKGHPFAQPLEPAKPTNLCEQCGEAPKMAGIHLCEECAAADDTGDGE